MAPFFTSVKPPLKRQNRGLRDLLAQAQRVLVCLSLSALFPAGAVAQVCAAPGTSGPATISAANTVVNTYYPGTAAGGLQNQPVLGYNSSSQIGAAAPIAVGDLVLVMQMQDGTGGSVANTAAYNLPGAVAGSYEFARVASVAANALTLTENLRNTYAQNLATSNNQTYQVIRVPQYSLLTINAGASMVPQPWTGTVGGVVVVDVAGAFVNNGAVNASYAGFRGNAGVTLGGVGGAPALTVATRDYVQPDTYTAHGGKGEGTAGTPDRVLNVFSAPGVLLTSGTSSANGTVTNVSATANSIAVIAAYLNATGRSYNGGSRANGAPGNAGGGAVDSAPAGNGENSGGGGGGGQGAGGQGGNTWNTNIALGGFGGPTSSPGLTNRLPLGGGGGSGDGNNNYQLDMSGGAGGGLIFIKAGTVGGGGSLLADGQAGRSVPVIGTNCPTGATANCDGAGGGGAGGGIVVLASSGSVANASVRGGQGGNINGTDHGPGGGGGGGYTIASSPLGFTSVVLPGVAGLINAGGVPAAYGAFPGQGGSGFAVPNGSLPVRAGGLPIDCLPALATTKTTSTPAASSPISAPGTTTYSIVVSNPAGRGDARGVTLLDPSLPAGLATVSNPPAPTVTFSAAPPSVCALATRTAVVNVPNAATGTFTAGTFDLPGGCAVTYTFAVNVGTSVPNGTFNNSAVAYFLDPTASVTGRTVTAALPPAASALGANVAYTTGGAVAGSNYDGNNAANTADDIRVQRSANITITKTNAATSLAAGSTTSYTVTVANAGPADASGAVLADPAATGLNCTAVTCTGATGTAVCPAPATVTIANLRSPPGPGITLDNLPANSSLSFLVVCGVTATGQ